MVVGRGAAVERPVVAAHEARGVPLPLVYETQPSLVRVYEFWCCGEVEAHHLSATWFSLALFDDVAFSA